MGLFSGAKSRAVPLTTGKQVNFLEGSVIPSSQGLLDTASNVDLEGLLGKFASGPTELTRLSLQGLENIAAGQGESSDLGQATNKTLIELLSKGPQDVEDFIQSTVFDPSLAEAERLLPFINRQGSDTGTRFGPVNTRARAELLAQVNLNSSAARASAVFQALQLDDATKLQAAALGTSAETIEIQNLLALAQSGNLQAEQELNNIAAILGIPLEAIQLAAQIGTAQTSGIGQKGANLLGESLAGAIGGIAQTAGIAGVAAIACHGAAIYFGWFTPAWFAAWRAIASGKLGVRFLAWYSAHSRGLAAVLKTDPVEYERWKPVFLRAARLGGLNE